MTMELESRAESGDGVTIQTIPIYSLIGTFQHLFQEHALKCTYEGVDRDSLDRDTISGLGTTFEFHRHLNEHHYAATHPEILQPVAPAFSAMIYADDYSACVAYDGKDYKAMTLGFPFECIKSEQKRQTLMKGILKFLLQSL